jgi:hypothetical protein
MKRFLACLALCASLSASAQDDNCTLLGVQELSALYYDLSQSIDSILLALNSAGGGQTITDIDVISTNGGTTYNSQATFLQNHNNQLLDSILQGWAPLYPPVRYTQQTSAVLVQTIVKYADD